MKNLFTLFIILSFFFQTIKAQTTSQKAINKGDMAVTAYCGFPNFLPATLKSAYQLNDQEKDQLEIKRPVPLGLTISYLVNDNLAIGGEISYERTQIKWRENGTLMGNDSTSILFSHHYALNASRVRLLVLLNYHLAIRKRSDFYFGFGIGYSHNISNLNTDFPDTSYNNVPPCFLPISARTKVGINYYLTEKIAVNTEVGIGGPLLSLGITGNF